MKTGKLKRRSKILTYSLGKRNNPLFPGFIKGPKDQSVENLKDLFDVLFGKSHYAKHAKKALKESYVGMKILNVRGDVLKAFIFNKNYICKLPHVIIIQTAIWNDWTVCRGDTHKYIPKHIKAIECKMLIGCETILVKSEPFDDRYIDAAITNIVYSYYGFKMNDVVTIYNSYT